MEWFELEGAAHFTLNRFLKTPLPELTAEEKETSAPEKKK
jgi:hypothetical protein